MILVCVILVCDYSSHTTWRIFLWQSALRFRKKQSTSGSSESPDSGQCLLWKFLPWEINGGASSYGQVTDKKASQWNIMERANVCPRNRKNNLLSEDHRTASEDGTWNTRTRGRFVEQVMYKLVMVNSIWQNSFDLFIYTILVSAHYNLPLGFAPPECTQWVLALFHSP